MPFCIQNDQIQKSQKIAKIAFFSKNQFFSNDHQSITDGQKWSQIVPRSVQNTFLTNIRCLHPFQTTFGKIEKNRFLKIFFDHASTKFAEFIFSGRISAKYYSGLKKHIKAPFRKKYSQLIWYSLVSTVKSILIDEFGQNPYFCTQVVLVTKKHQKYKNLYFFKICKI